MQMTEWEGPTSIVSVSEVQLRENGEEVILEDTMDENVPGLVNDMNLQINYTHTVYSAEYIKISHTFSEIF